jgi:hypothetical protein
MANVVYNRGLYRMGVYRWSGGLVDLGVMLVANTYVFNRAHNTVSQVVADETSGPGYGRRPIGAEVRTVVESDGSNWAQFHITDGAVTWSAIDAGIDLRVILFCVNTGDISNNANDLLVYYDTGTLIPVTTDGSDFRLNFNSLGAFTMSQV